jgi:pimeloyl-ACP methyl ester carboxylesterase
LGTQHARVASTGDQVVEQGGLADSGLAVEHDRPGVTVAGLAEQGGEARSFGFPAVQHGLTLLAVGRAERRTTRHFDRGEHPVTRPPSRARPAGKEITMTTAVLSAHDPFTVDHPRGPIGRIVAASLGTGLLSALALTLFVVPGAPEPVITGWGLICLALGATMLAVLSARLTDQPQRWAVVPATASGVTGAALLLVAPGNDALTTAGWIWPPILFALAAWSAVRARRSLRTRVRAWLLYPVIALLALAAVGGGYETVRTAQDRSSFAMPGRSYDVGGRRLHLSCTGTGSPTVVLENGLGESSPFWSRITPAVGRGTRVCAYDRAGQGWSDDAPHPLDGRRSAADLHTLLDRAGEHGPFILVGHSTGGTYAMTYAARYPEQVAGIVLLDSSSPDQFTVLPDFPGQYAVMRRTLALLPSLARTGLARLAPSSTWSNLPEPAAAQVRAFAADARGARSTRDEQSVLPAVFEQARALSTLGGKPLVVLTASDNLRSVRGWSGAQDQLATLSSNCSHRIADATHVGLLDDPAAAAVSVRAIEDVVRSARTGTPLTP